MNIRLVIAFLLAISVVGCAQTETKKTAFPGMYTDQKPVTMLIVPAINDSTAANAGNLLNVTVAQPFANQGYYVLSVPIVADIFAAEGILEGSQVRDIPASVFREQFGADSVLFLTIENWDTNYLVLAANVSVAIEYVLISTSTNEVLWSYKEKVVVDTGSSSGNIFVDLIATAITTAVTDYVPIARTVHETAVVAMPYGGYHPKSGLDGDDKTVKTKAKTGALEEFEGGMGGGIAASQVIPEAESKKEQGAAAHDEAVSNENADVERLPEAEQVEEVDSLFPQTRAQAEVVGESMSCTESFMLKSMSAKSEVWEILCADGKTLKVECFGEECFIK